MRGRNSTRPPTTIGVDEALPADTWNTAEQACRGCDVLLVVGTSAVVYPAAGLIDTARNAGARIIHVNTQPSEATTGADIELLGPAGDLVPKLL